jgi:PAS domain S-box-containing protein
VSVRILFVEDSQDDVELQLRRLRESGVQPHWDRVQTEEALRDALAGESWHVALVDYDIPGYSGLEALHLIADLAPDLPAVTVSGAIDEDTAVATMSAGAVDYVLKDNLTRLAPAVRRAMDGADLRRAHRQAAEAARLALFAVDNASLAVTMVARDGTVVYVNDHACGVLARERGELVGKMIWELDQAIPREAWEESWARVVAEGAIEFRVDRRQPDGDRVVLDVTANYLEGDDVLVSYGRDISRRVMAEERVRESEERFELFAEHFPGYLFINDADLRCVYTNQPDAVDPSGRRGDWIGKRPTQIWSGEHAAEAEDRLRRALSEEQLDVVVPWEGANGVEHLHSIYFRIPRGERPPLIGGLSVDVSEQFRAQEEVRRQTEQLRRTVEGAVLAMSQVVETRDPYTAGHERRVAELATVIGRDLGLGAVELDGLRLGALIHDIGKISVPAEILAKPGRLSEVEFNLIKQHSRAGYDILSVIDFGRPVAEMVLQHHERLDGSGYPQGLTTEDLLPETRILAVADVVEAMSSHRPYRAALGRDAALAEIRDGAGTRYDPDVVAACERAMVVDDFRFSP